MTNSSQFCFDAPRPQKLAVKSLVLSGREVPGGAGRIQNFVIQPDKTQVFSKTVWVIGCWWRQIPLQAEAQSAPVEEPRQHRSAGTVGTSNTNNFLFHEAVGRLTMD